MKKKQKGEKIERQKEREPSNVVDLMEALRQSVSAGEGGGERRNHPPILPPIIVGLRGRVRAEVTKKQMYDCAF